MNDEYRKKILNRYVEHAEQEDTQERRAYLDAKANIMDLYADTFSLARNVVKRSYPDEDVETCQELKSACVGPHRTKQCSKPCGPRKSSPFSWSW